MTILSVWGNAPSGSLPSSVGNYLNASSLGKAQRPKKESGTNMNHVCATHRYLGAKTRLKKTVLLLVCNDVQTSGLPSMTKFVLLNLFSMLPRKNGFVSASTILLAKFSQAWRPTIYQLELKISVNCAAYVWKLVCVILGLDDYFSTLNE